MTYIAYWFHAFSQMEKVENAGRRVEKFVNNMQGAWEMQSNFERRMRELLKKIREQVVRWQESKFEGTYVDAKRQATEFSAHKRGNKREWVAEKSDLAALLGNIKPSPQPPGRGTLVRRSDGIQLVQTAWTDPPT